MREMPLYGERPKPPIVSTGRNAGMTSDPTSSVPSIGYAVRGVRPSPGRDEAAASTPARSPQSAEQPAQQPVRKGGNSGYAGERGKPERGHTVNFRV